MEHHSIIAPIQIPCCRRWYCGFSLIRRCQPFNQYGSENDANSRHLCSCIFSVKKYLLRPCRQFRTLIPVPYSISLTIILTSFMSTSHFTLFKFILCTVLSSIIMWRIDYSNKTLWPPNRFEPIVWATAYCFHCVATQRKAQTKHTKNTKRRTNSCWTGIRTRLISSRLLRLFPVYCFPLKVVS